MFGVLKDLTPIGRFVCLLVLITNLSQLSVFVDAGTTQYLSFPIWGLAVLVCLIKGISLKLSSVRNIVAWFVFFFFWFLMLGMVDDAYNRSALPSVIGIAFFVLVMGTCFGQRVTDKDLEYIYACYIISSLIVGFDVYKMYLEGQSFDTRSYLYNSKNSLCQILLTAWTLIVFTKFKSQKVFLKYTYILIFLFLTFEICVLKSRASIIGMPIIICIAVMNDHVPKAVRRYSMLFLLGVVVLMLNENFYNFFVDNVLYGGRDANDINDLSSGRAVEWANFLKDWSNPIMGQGRCKRESLILTALLEFGLIGGIPILILGFYPVYYSVKQYKLYRNNVHFLVLVALSLTYCLNGVFEQLAPFGPGVKCYFLWMMLGIMSYRNKYAYR